MDRIRTQANKLGSLLADSETRQIYGRTLQLTWQILRETALLLWLVVCLLLVGLNWGWNASIQAGRGFRAWTSDLKPSEESDPLSSANLSDVGQNLLSAGAAGANFLVRQAREQVGLPQPPEPEPAAIAPAPKPSAPPAPAAAAPSPAETAPPETAPAQSAPPQETPAPAASADESA